MLLAHGAEDDTPEDDYTALMRASFDGYTAIVDALLSSGVDVNARNRYGRTALYASLHRKGHEEIVKLLLLHGADVNAITNDGETALMFASEKGHGEIVDLLLSSGANANPKTNDGRTALMVALGNGDDAIVNLLLSTNEVDPGAPFVIPLEAEFPARETDTRAEMFFVQDIDRVLVVSFDCNECYGESMLTADGAKLLVWAPGAEHIYTGRTVQEGFEVRLAFTNAKTDSEGVLLFYGSSGTAATANKIRGWSIHGDPDNPLVFKVVKEMGYVYVEGSGTVTAPDGATHNLGN